MCGVIPYECPNYNECGGWIIARGCPKCQSKEFVNAEENGI